MARQPAVIRPYVKEYHVYDPGIGTELATGFPVIDRGEGVRVVRLTPQQAQYFIDQGAIGEEPLSERTEEAQILIRQFRHLSEDKPEEQ